MAHALRTGRVGRIDDVRAFFASMNALWLEPEAFDVSAQLRADHPSLKTPDALHLATALHHGCTELWTNDLDLAKKSVGLALRTF